MNPEGASFAPHPLAARRIDVASLPFWYLTGSPELVRGIAARAVLATRVPPGDTAEARRRMAAALPGATVLARPGDVGPPGER